MKLSKHSMKALEAFDEAARNYGWASDQGDEEHANEASQQYVKAEAKLEHRLLYLERRVKKLIRELKIMGCPNV